MAVQFTPLLRLPEFVLGILLGRAFTSGAFARLQGKPLVWLAVLPLFAIGLNTRHIPHPLLATSLLAPFFALLLVTLATGAGPLVRFLSQPWMKLLGEASYAIYILQIPVMLMFAIEQHPHSGLRIGLYLIALVLFSLLCFHYIESPLRLRLKAWFGEARDLERRSSSVHPVSASANRL